MTKVHHWRYSDGWGDILGIPRDKNSTTTNDRVFDEDLKGWFCWVYSDNDDKFIQWMEQNMKGKYDATFRFNSGNPMMTVWIKEDEDATLFKLTWM